MSKGINKKGVSLMVSYVLLISIALIMAGGIYFWIKASSNIAQAPECIKDTTAIIEDFECGDQLTLNIKNNGRFNVSGVIVGVGNNPESVPESYLIAAGPQPNNLAGHYFFESPLKPGDNKEAVFVPITTDGELTYNNIGVIQLQPFIIENRLRTACSEAVIKQELTNCILGTSS